MAKIFIIHSKYDAAIAEAITAKARAHGHKTVDPFLPGQDYEAVMNQAIGAADVVVLLWSIASARSAWVESETRQALKAWAQDRLLVAALDDTPLPAGLRDQISVRPQPTPEMFAAAVAREIDGFVSRRTPVPAPQAPRAAAQSAERAAGGARFSIRRLLGHITLIALVASLAGWWFAQSQQDLPALSPFIELIAAKVMIALLAIATVVLVAFATVKLFRSLSRARRKGNVGAPPPPQPAAHAVAAPQIFISYSRKDSSLVDRLVNLMQSEGIGVWIDRSEQEMGGRRYAGPIVRAIRDSKAVAVMCSRHAFDSDHVVREVYVAGDFKKPFLNVHLDGEDFPDDLRYFLTGFPRVSAQEFEQRRAREVIDPLLQYGRS